MTQEKQPFYVHCTECGHEWIALYFPLVLDKKGMKLMKSVGKAPCPMCAGTKVMCGKSPAPTTQAEMAV